MLLMEETYSWSLRLKLVFGCCLLLTMFSYWLYILDVLFLELIGLYLQI
jgi:hypothetical protein